MPDFAANVSAMFTDVPLQQRFEAAARCGFAAIELAFPYALAKEELVRLRRDTGLTLVAFNLPAGNWQAGDRGIGCDPQRVKEFRDGFRQAIDYAAALNCRFLNCLAGILPDGVSAKAAQQTLVDNLAFAAERARAVSITVLLEAVHAITLPRSFVASTGQALEVLDAVGARNVALLCDIYRMHAAGEPIAANVRRYLTRIGHIRIARWPARIDPVRGQIDYDEVLCLIDRIGYRGWIGCEYTSNADTERGLPWIARSSPLMRPVPTRWSIPVSALRNAG